MEPVPNRGGPSRSRPYGDLYHIYGNLGNYFHSVYLEPGDTGDSLNHRVRSMNLYGHSGAVLAESKMPRFSIAPYVAGDPIYSSKINIITDNEGNMLNSQTPPAPSTKKSKRRKK